MLVACLAGTGAVVTDGFPNPATDAAAQWYLTQDNAWSFWPARPALAPIKVAVIDSGIDYGHPEFAGRIVAGRSFVGGSWKRDTDGHGTFVAGEIAADPINGIGIAGLAFNAELLIAKVVTPDDSVSLPGEIEAIRWAADRGARVINLSLGGVRDPLNARLDTHSAAEQSAIAYAYSKGAIVVAAVGNGSESPATPWDYADYPAALPHVIGVGAIRRNGSVPAYSNRDALYVDLVAPGDGILSTVPRNLVDTSSPSCTGNPYSNCGPFEYRNAIGTSFAAPQVSAAAALVLGEDPTLTADQVSWLLERSAADMKPSTGCAQCALGRDRYTGWGRLDVAHALRMLTAGIRLPPPDRYASNDGNGRFAQRFGPARTITASVDFWDDPADIYAITLPTGRGLFARLTPKAPNQEARIALVLWKPGRYPVAQTPPPPGRQAALAITVHGQQRIAFEVRSGGTYYIEAKLNTRTYYPVVYTLAIATRAGHVRAPSNGSTGTRKVHS